MNDQIKHSKKLIFITTIALSIISVSCSMVAPYVQTVQTQTSSAATKQEPSVLPTLRPQPTRTQPPSTTSLQLLTITPTPTQIQLPSIKTHCLQSIQSPAPKFTGRIVLSSPKDERVPGYMANSISDSPTYLLDLQTGERIQLGQTKFESVSPDGSKIAYYDVEQEMVVVADARGNRLREISAPKRDQFPAYWLDNQRLLLNKNLNNPNSPLGSLIILDSLSWEQREILPAFQSQNQGYIFYWHVTSNLVFDPSLTHVIYPLDSDSLPLILWDVQTKSVVARIYGPSRRDTPWWSPDGKSFITSAPIKPKAYQGIYGNVDDGLPYKGGTELWLVRLTGEVRRLTYFTVTNPNVVQDNYVWSPDGRKIAFLLLDTLGVDTENHSLPPELMVVDVETREVTNYCRLARLPETDDGRFIQPPDAVWSPDGQYLVVTQADENLHYKVFLVDMQNGSAWQIAENAAADGWMTSEP